jgi:hypothetical protein
LLKFLKSKLLLFHFNFPSIKYKLISIISNSL